MVSLEQRKNELKELLSEATSIACLTGAGISTESGIPDFRSSSGIYSTMCSEEVFDIDNFNRHPGEFYRIMAPIYKAMLEGRPNAGHLGLARLEAAGHRVLVATQNIDGLHQRAGSREVKELHGSMMTLTCMDCGMSLPLSAVREDALAGRLLRHSMGGGACHGILKPDIVFYGEGLPEAAFEESLEAFASADVVLVMGTSLAVYPAADLPRHRLQVSRLVIVNRTPTPLDAAADMVFREDIGSVMEIDWPRADG